MNYLEFKNKTRKIPIFSTNDLALFLGEKMNHSFLNNLKNWEKKGYILKIRKGLFIHTDLKNSFEPLQLANKIYPPSYVSMESALCHYEIIPEMVFITTSITTRKTNSFENDFGKFIFQKIKKDAFGGFETFYNKEVELSYNLALPEKALADFFYLNRNILDGTKKQFKEYRFEEDFNYNIKRLKKYSKIFNNKKTSLLINNFIKYYVT